MHGIKARLNNQPVFLEIKHRKLFINPTDVSIPLSDILSLKTKNEGDSFFLMVKTPNDRKFILEFLNYNVRDLCKSLLLASISDTGIYKEIDYDTSKFITSLSAPLLSIFSDMNCTISQFYNHLMQSNFYDPRNKLTSLDRLITEKLRKEDININSLTRINNYSLLMMNEDTVTKPITSISKEINFQPIYDLENERGSEIEDNLELEVEESISDLKIDKKELKKILEISKKLYRKEEVDEESLKFLDQYRNVKHVRRLIVHN